MIQDELAKKEMEKPVNLRNVERSLLKRVVELFSIAGFSMNPEMENYFVASTEFFSLESIRRRNYSYTPRGSLVHTNYNTLVGSTTCKCECFCLFIMF